MSDLADDVLVIDWRPIAELQVGRMALLRAPTNSHHRRETVFYGYRQPGPSPLYHDIYFELQQVRLMLIEPDAFALVPGM